MSEKVRTQMDLHCDRRELYLDKCKEVLRHDGARITKPRIAVMQCLAQSPESLSPRKILEAIREDKSLENIDQVSVYRILETFQKLGLVHQVYPSGGFIACSHLDCRHELHILMRCSQCEKAEEVHLPEEILGPTVWYLKEKYDFLPREHLFQIDGTCGICAAASGALVAREMAQ